MIKIKFVCETKILIFYLSRKSLIVYYVFFDSHKDLLSYCHATRVCRTRMKVFKWDNLSPLLRKEGTEIIPLKDILNEFCNTLRSPVAGRNGREENRCGVCQKNSEFKAEIQRHFLKKFHRGSKFSNLMKVKIRAVFSMENRHFLQIAVIQSLTNGRPSLTPTKGELGLPVRAPRGCNGALIALQRQPRCNPTGTPL